MLGDAGVLEEDELDIVGLEVGVGLTDEAHEMHLLISGIVSLSAALQAENTKKTYLDRGIKALSKNQIF